MKIQIQNSVAEIADQIRQGCYCMGPNGPIAVICDNFEVSSFTRLEMMDITT